MMTVCECANLLKVILPATIRRAARTDMHVSRYLVRSRFKLPVWWLPKQFCLFPPTNLPGSISAVLRRPTYSTRALQRAGSDRDAIVEKFRKNVQGHVLQPPIQAVIDKELEKLSCLDQNSSEFSVIRNHLDWLTNLPWGLTSEDTIDLGHAKKVLDEDHYGLHSIKDRILELIAISQLNKSVPGKALCFVGPPGTGKTSISSSIARALNRKYYRLNVGGMNDVAEIKGYWQRGLPGKVIQCLKETQTENPVVLIDEVDKIGCGIQGNLISALIELLDPKQNSNFLDHYLDVLFLCAANAVGPIPGSLQDCTEIINVSGYALDEKKAIAEQYLVPTARSNAGLKNDQVVLEPAAIEELIKQYCRESGVKNLQKHIDKIFRKSALKIVENPEANTPIRVSCNSLKDFIGNPTLTTSDEVTKTVSKNCLGGLEILGIIMMVWLAPFGILFMAMLAQIWCDFIDNFTSWIWDLLSSLWK